MSDVSHTQVLDAIDKARRPQPVPEHRPCACHREADDRNQHCDDLMDLAVWHKPLSDEWMICAEGCGDWPCDTIRLIVMERLTAWGVTDE